MGQRYLKILGLVMHYGLQAARQARAGFRSKGYMPYY